MQIKRLKVSSFTDLVCGPILAAKYYNHDLVHNTRCAIKMEIKTESFVIGSSFLPSATKLRQVMFLHLSVSHSVHRGVCLSACWDTHNPGQTPPWADTLLGRHPPLADTPADVYCSGRYASYWDAFLFVQIFTSNR